MTSAAIIALRVAATPEAAFRIFTDDIGLWWRGNPLFPLTPHGDGVLSFEPGPEGRLVTALPGGTVFEVGRIKVWSPGERLVLSWRHAGFAPDQETEVEVRFEPVDAETRVTVEHRGWDKIPQDHQARHGFELMLFQQRLAECWRTRLQAVRQIIDQSADD
jgi:uncharacterized protein YndB with AHSA1/START domain